MSRPIAPYVIEIRDVLLQHFDWPDLEELCFQLRIHFDDIKGQTCRDKARDLVLYCDKYGRLDDLKVEMLKARPFLTL